MTNSLFGIVDSDYALYIDPWFHPYWCYGFGALGMTLVLEPAKDWLLTLPTAEAGGFSLRCR